MGILPIRELARIPARDPDGRFRPALAAADGPRIKSNGKSKAASLLPFASARRTRALWLFPGTHGLAAAAVDQARRVRARDRAHSAVAQDVQSAEPGRWRGPFGQEPERRKALGRVSLVPFFARAKKGTRSPQASGSLCS